MRGDGARSAPQRPFPGQASGGTLRRGSPAGLPSAASPRLPFPPLPSFPADPYSASRRVAVRSGPASRGGPVTHRAARPRLSSAPGGRACRRGLAGPRAPHGGSGLVPPAAAPGGAVLGPRGSLGRALAQLLSPTALGRPPAPAPAPVLLSGPLPSRAGLGARARTVTSPQKGLNVTKNSTGSRAGCRSRK